VGPRGVLDDGGEEKNSQLLPGIEPYNPDRPANVERMVEENRRITVDGIAEAFMCLAQ